MTDTPVVGSDGGQLAKVATRGAVTTIADRPIALRSKPDKGPPLNPDTVWTLDPTQLALEGSAWRQDVLPTAFCNEVGRRLLLAELEFSEWILRRVEKIDLSKDRSVSRKIALEYSLRDDAPTFATEGQRLRVIPLSLMRRRTLVSLKLEDADGNAVLMPGLRLTQQLDQAILLAAAADLEPGLAADPEVVRFVQLAIAGDLSQVIESYQDFDTARRGPLARLREHDLFRLVANRFRHNFTLYTFVDVSKGPTQGGHRLIRLSFDEPISWGYQEPQLLEVQPNPPVYDYVPGRTRRITARRALAALGLRPIRVRFQIPGAECAASYHLEIASPPGLQIVQAALLAGRPNNPERHASEDVVTGHTPVVGLHAVEIPNGSLCRAQIDLGVPTRGWLAAMAASSMAICGVLLSVAMHTRFLGNEDAINNLDLILVSTAAAAATIVTQRSAGGVAERFVTGLRALGTACILLPLVVAGIITYADLAGSRHLERNTWLATGAALAIVVILLGALVRSWWSQRHAVARESPWDQTDSSRDEGTIRSPRPDFMASLDQLGFDTPAVGVRSAEGWFERYEWNDELQWQAVTRLRTAHAQRLRPPTCLSVNDLCSSGMCVPEHTQISL
jgi:hypothetical protein